MANKEETGENGDNRETEIWKANEGSLALEDPNHEDKYTSLMISKEETGENRENSAMEASRIENFNQISPRGVLKIPNTGVIDSDNCSSVSSSSSDESIPPQCMNLKCYSLHWKTLTSGFLLKKKPVRWRSSILPLMTSSETSKKSLRRILSAEDPKVDGGESVSMVRWKPSWRSFDYQELAAATDNFSSEKLIGKGGHAEVYRGCLPDGELVAVKRLTKKETEEERITDFLCELGIIAHVNHPNAAHLLGFGVEGGLHLVLQFSPHGSLASILHGSREHLEWGIRFKIALGIAEGLLYLHQGCHRRIIHRDIKASNILLTQDYQPQISDFGLAKWLPDKWTHHIVFPIEGTFGYLAPEYFMHGVVNEKTDVFAFGVLLLELIAGRRAIDSFLQSLVIWAKPLLDTSNVKELVDPSLGDAYEPSEMSRAISAASACIHHVSTMRPHMNQIVQLLRGDQNASAEIIVREPKAVTDSEDYTCTKYLNDLNRHKQLVLEQ